MCSFTTLPPSHRLRDDDRLSSDCQLYVVKFVFRFLFFFSSPTSTCYADEIHSGAWWTPRIIMKRTPRVRIVVPGPWREAVTEKKNHCNKTLYAAVATVNDTRIIYNNEFPSCGHMQTFLTLKTTKYKNKNLNQS